jgi:hypothetical protein
MLKEWSLPRLMIQYCIWCVVLNKYDWYFGTRSYNHSLLTQRNQPLSALPGKVPTRIATHQFWAAQKPERHGNNRIYPCACRETRALWICNRLCTVVYSGGYAS